MDSGETICEKCCGNLNNYGKKAEMLDYACKNIIKRITVLEDYNLAPILLEEGVMTMGIVDRHETVVSYHDKGKPIKGNLAIHIAKALGLIVS